MSGHDGFSDDRDNKVEIRVDTVFYRMKTGAKYGKQAANEPATTLATHRIKPSNAWCFINSKKRGRQSSRTERERHGACQRLS